MKPLLFESEALQHHLHPNHLKSQVQSDRAIVTITTNAAVCEKVNLERLRILTFYRS